MASLSPPAGTQEPSIGRGGGRIDPPVSFGGGDGRGSDGFPDYGQRLRRARLGLMIALAPIVVMFVVFSLIYVLRLSMPNLDEDGVALARAWSSVKLPTAILLVNTFLLLLSSVTIEMARRRITRKAALAPVLSIPGVSLGKEPRFPWLMATVMLGLAFIGGQWIAWRGLMARGFYVATNPSASFVYVLTATHALHLAGGIGVLFYTGTISALKRPVEVRRIFVDVTAWYWHFMALLWVYILAVLELAR